MYYFIFYFFFCGINKCCCCCCYTQSSGNNKEHNLSPPWEVFNEMCHAKGAYDYQHTHPLLKVVAQYYCGHMQDF